MSKRSGGRKTLGLIGILCCSWAWIGQAQADVSPSGVVGEVIAAIGESRILSEAGQAQATLRGAHVRAGDSIETAAGGHVHIRFVDGALVSVRPLSRLSIEAYRDRDEQAPAAIKFRLEEGVMRSVTGRWGEANRERFRLNTPIAAIGIKGTDFVVRTAPENTHAAVISGAIVMAPLEGDCARALGPCGGERAVELTAEMAGLMLEMQRSGGALKPRLVPAVDLLAGTARSRMALPAPRKSEALEAVDVVEKLPVSDVGAASQIAEGAAAESAAAPVAARPLPLRWLHNAAGWNVPANTISQRYDEALAAGRSATVGNLFITLYRDETTLKSFRPEGTTVAFTLREASAVYAPGGGKANEPLAVAGAVLNVDFPRSTYATHLDLSGPSLGRASFESSGSIDARGIMSEHQAKQNLVGALGMDGREAAYLFAKALPGGVVSGLTLWGR